MSLPLKVNQTVCLEQLAGLNLPREIDVSAAAVSAWTPNSSIDASALRRPTIPNQNGFVYQNASTAGQTAALEPAWPTPAGETVQDGSVTWTAVVPPVAGEDQIQSASWTQVEPPDSQLQITNQSNTAMVAGAYLGGGTSGNVYTIMVVITMVSGAELGVRIYLTVL